MSWQSTADYRQDVRAGLYSFAFSPLLHPIMLEVQAINTAWTITGNRFSVMPLPPRLYRLHNHYYSQKSLPPTSLSPSIHPLLENYFSINLLLRASVTLSHDCSNCFMYFPSPCFFPLSFMCIPPPLLLLRPAFMLYVCFKICCDFTAQLLPHQKPSASLT